MIQHLLLQTIPKQSISSSFAYGLVWAILFYLLLSDLYQSTKQVVLTQTLLLRGLAIIYCLALHSLFLQAKGLIGEHGLHPLPQTLKTLHSYLNTTIADDNNDDYTMKMMLRLVYEKFHSPDSIINDHLTRVMKIDLLISVITILFPHPVLFAYAYLSYYSYKRLTGPFLNFQWDILLLESLYHAIALSLCCHSHHNEMMKIGLWSMKTLLVRLMLGSGLVKAYSRDTSWSKNYTAMKYHFWTQPLPSILGLVFHCCTPAVNLLQGVTVLTIITELHLPLLSLCNLSILNVIIAWSYILLMVGIVNTGYFGFFNYLTMVLSLCLLEDHQLGIDSSSLPAGLLHLLHPHTLKDALSTYGYRTYLELFSNALALCMIGFAMICHCVAFVLLLERCGIAKRHDDHGDNDGENNGNCCCSWWQWFYQTCNNIHSYGQRVAYLGNHYGLFANMTKWRDEIIIEVSADDKTWHMIAWKYKPDSIFLPPKRVRPDYHMPRLDWLMWFLAFKPSVEYYPKWSIVFLLSLLEENEDVLALLHPLTKTTMQILTTQCKDRERWKLRLSRRRYNYDNKSFRISSFMELWMGHRPEPSLTDYPISSTDDEVIAIPAEKDMFWNVGDSQLLIPPSSLADLYAILETNLSTTTSSSSSNRRQQPPPSVETAQEIIMRTLFRNAKNRAAAAATTRQQQQQELRNDEEKESQQANEISKKTE
eukprot:gene9676-10699_t